MSAASRRDDDDYLTRPNTTHFITIIYDNGRLGNRMFQYAVLLGFARRTHRQPIVDCDGRLSPMYPRIAAECTPHAGKRFAKLAPSEQHLKLKGKLQVGRILNARENNITIVSFEFRHLIRPWGDFRNMSHIIRRQFQLSTNATALASDFMTSLIVRYKRNANVTGDVTPIALHVRRGDFLSSSSIAVGRPVATPHYFYNAMTYFRQRYANCLFIVASDDARWCRKHLLARDVMLIADHKLNSTVKFRDEVERDVSVLRLVEHSILSSDSTFSWWIGWFTPGEVVYYRKPRAQNETYLYVRGNDFYLSRWKEMT